MFQALKDLLQKVDSDYADVRYETKKETAVVFSGRELTAVGSSLTDGYVLRVLKNGGFSSVAFTRFEDHEDAVQKAVENAKILSKGIREPVRMARAEVIAGTFLPKLEEDPRRITIDEKLDLTRHYNDIPLGRPGIATTQISYNELIREKYFVNTEGGMIREDLVTTSIGGTITSKDGTLVQSVRAGLGGSSGFSILRNGEDEFEKKASVAQSLLGAEPVEGGVCRVVLSPRLAGVFTHEAFGHFSEADLIEDSPTMRGKMKLGAKLGSDLLSIRDDPTVPGQLGFYYRDDEGVAARPVQLMRNGVLTGRLHSRRTAAAFGEPLTGHCVAEDYRYAPIIRMGTIFIEPGTDSVETLFERLGDGYYFVDPRGGQTSGESFTFGAQWGYRIKNGRKAAMIRDINISGNLYETLHRISGIGNDLEFSRIGGCGKGQMNPRSCYGAPHILIENVTVGGR